MIKQYSHIRGQAINAAAAVLKLAFMKPQFSVEMVNRDRLAQTVQITKAARESGFCSFC